MIAEPAMPVWPATNTRFPTRSRGAERRSGWMSIGDVVDTGALGGDKAQISGDHFGHEFLKRGLVAPTELFPCLRGVAEQEIDFGGTKIARIHPHQYASRFGINSRFIHARTTPTDFYLYLGKGTFDEFADRVMFARCQDIIVGLRVLENPPHALDEVTRVPPIAFGIEVSKKQRLLKAKLYGGNRPGNFAGHEGLAACRTLMVEQNTIAGVKAI